MQRTPCWQIGIRSPGSFWPIGSGVQLKGRNRHIKARAVFSHKEITALHAACGRWNLAAAGVLKALTWLEQGLVAHDPQAANLLRLIGFTLNDPVPADQLRADRAGIGDLYGVGMPIDLRRRIRLLC